MCLSCKLWSIKVWISCSITSYHKHCAKIELGCRMVDVGWGWKETPWCWSPGMQHARERALLAPNQNAFKTPPISLPTSAPFLPLLPPTTTPLSSLSLFHNPWNRRATISASSEKISDHSERVSGQTAFLPPAAAAVAGRLLQRASRIDFWRRPGYQNMPVVWESKRHAAQTHTVYAE